MRPLRKIPFLKYGLLETTEEEKTETERKLDKVRQTLASDAEEELEEEEIGNEEEK